MDRIRLLDPYAGYYRSGAAGLTGRRIQDDRLPAKTLVAGAAAGGSALAIPLASLEASGWVQADDGRESSGIELRCPLRVAAGIFT